jgi:mono/diheme cytochrome c family protein
MRSFAMALLALFAAARVPAAEPDLLSPALEGPLRDLEHIIYCTRLPYDDSHWYANIGYYCDDENLKAYAGNGKPDVGKLCLLNLRSRSVSVVFDSQGGSVRDPQPHYDGRRILFSYRPASTDFYHLYEINVDGSGLRQLTDGPFDDIEAVYLPCGDIVFVSTRCRRWVNCWMTQVAILHRCDANGGNIHAISANTEHDNTPWVLPDGRILYTRWEYVDRSQVEFHHLWTMNPDGTGQTVYYGNQRPHIVMIGAKPIPGTSEILACFSPGHGVTEHAGIATIVVPDLGPDEPASARQLHRGRLIRDPYPLTDDLFMVARDSHLVLLNRAGQMQVIHTNTGPGQIHEPRPIRSRPREPVIASRVHAERETGVMVLANAYEGRNMAGVQPGDIRRLLVLESLPKPVNFSGGPDLTSWLGTFTLQRVLGTVPVEPDGSANFHVPAHRQLFFVALDEHDLSVKRMQSFASVMPGEVVGCVGCHEPRTRAPEHHYARSLDALRRPSSKIQRFDGYPDVLDFPRDIQPILDRHCVGCHGYEQRKGGVLLGGDLGPTWSHAYFNLLAWRQVADGHNGLGNQPARALGSSASALLKKVDGSHNDVQVSAEEWRTLWLWIESGAPYAGSYAALRNAEEQKLAGAAVNQVFKSAHVVISQNCASCHSSTNFAELKPKTLPFEARNEQRRALAGKPTAEYERIVFANDPIARYSINVLLNFSRPDRSLLLLAPLPTSSGGYATCAYSFTDARDPSYLALLEAISNGKAIVSAQPRYATEGFQPNPQYIRELKRFGVLPASYNPAISPLDGFASDQAYWRALWHKPQPAH